jgi:hypothetical protein
MTKKNAVFRDVTPLSDVLEERIASIIKAERISELGTALAVGFLRSVLQLIVTANVVPSSPILVHSDDGGDNFLRNVFSYKSHTASLPEGYSS